MRVSVQPATRSWKQPLGAGGGWRRRLLFHHAPLALASAVVLVLFMSLSPFDANKYPPGDLFSGTFPKEFGEGQGQGTMQHGPQSGPMGSGGGQGPQRQGADHQRPQQHRGGQMPSQPGGEQTGALEDSGGRASGRSLFGLRVRRFTFATGYVALVLLGLTLLIGPANLLLRRRRPISNYLARDVGTWAAVFSVVHVIYGVDVHGGLTLSGFLNMLFRNDASPMTNSFGLANWTGLAATVIVVGLLALSNNLALRRLKARTWKNLQRLNYAVFALVIAHAFFYGALVRLESPFTPLLGLSVIAVLVGQGMGIWLWRRRYARPAAAAA